MGSESARRAASWGGVPMKHISLITVSERERWWCSNCTDLLPQLTFQNSALILVRAPPPRADGALRDLKPA